jgi:tRNA(adenine34) deaminase
MRAALAQAELALEAGEVPVGAVIVQGEQIIAQAHNQTRSNKDPTAHAELIALRQAALLLANERLLGCTLVCTLEPCAMCVGAIVHARVERLVFAAPEPKTGACGSAFDLLSDPAHNHRVHVERGVLQEESSALLRRFFSDKRNLAVRQAGDKQ